MPKNVPSVGEIILYKGVGADKTVHVTLDDDTVWLTQQQMSKLFGVGVPTINYHVQKVFKDGELKPKPTLRKFRIVQKEGSRHIERSIEQYNLDMIISVGYRVNSKEGTRFRQWATSVLTGHLVKGYTLNQRRLRDVRLKDLSELEKTVGMIRSAADRRQLSEDEAKGLLHVITDYARSWATLHQFDDGELPFRVRTTKKLRDFEEAEAARAIALLAKDLRKKGTASELFGQERPVGGLQSILRNLHQTFDAEPLYMSVEERAAHLLYFIIKDHPFVDGNKRIGSLLFVLYLRKHGKLKSGSERRIGDSALVALALLIAQSDAREKERMIALVQNLI